MKKKIDLRTKEGKTYKKRCAGLVKARRILAIKKKGRWTVKDRKNILDASLENTQMQKEKRQTFWREVIDSFVDLFRG